MPYRYPEPRPVYHPEKRVVYRADPSSRSYMAVRMSVAAESADCIPTEWFDTRMVHVNDDPGEPRRICIQEEDSRRLAGIGRGGCMEESCHAGSYVIQRTP